METKPRYDVPDDSYSFRWGIDLLDNGHVQIPNIFFRRYAQAGVSRLEFLFILHLAAYKYEQEGSECRPSLVRIAKEMGYDGPHSVYRLSSSLEEKGMLIIERRAGQPSIYNFRPLSLALISDTPDKNVTGGKNDKEPVAKMALPPVTKMAPKKEEPKEDQEQCPATPSQSDPPPATLNAWLVRLKEPGCNRTALLRYMLTVHFPDSEPPEFSKVGAVAKRLHAGRLAQLIWENSGRRITGCPLDYLQAVSNGGKKQSEERTPNISDAAMAALRAI